MIVIGITGPTGAGKTTALGVLQQLGGCVLDADAAYHRLLEENFALRGELETCFGPMTGADGRFDRKRLGAAVFSDKQAMERLNAITHPYMQRAFKQFLAEAGRTGCPAAAIDAIRLLESGAAGLCDLTVAIVAPLEIRINRIMAREGVSRDYARARAAAQPPDGFYTGQCEYALVNDCADQAEFKDRARTLFESILTNDKQYYDKRRV